MWKFHEEEIDNKTVADFAVFSFLKIIAKINKFAHITEYNKNEQLNSRVKEGFKVHMDFGLH